MSVKIAIDAGHGLYTAGKRCLKSIDPNETREWTLNSRIADQVCAHLKRCGGETLRLDDTTGETDVALSTRTKNANAWDADWCISIHHNAGINGGSGGGAVVFVYSGTHSSKSDDLQKAIYNGLIGETGKFGNRSQPLASKNLHMVRETNMPAVLIEAGFMDSTVDTPMILTEDFAAKAARGIAKGICATAGLTWTEETTTAATTGTSAAAETATDPAESYDKSLAGTYQVTASSLNMRSGAGAGKSVMVALPKGTKVKNYGYYTAVSGKKWLYVQVTYNSTTYTGFCSSAYLSKC